MSKHRLDQVGKAGDSGASFPVVGIGASAGGLDACRKLLDAIPPKSGMSFILVQHLDPAHQSMMVDLLTGDRSIAVLEATDGMPIAPDHLYVIPPGAYLSVAQGILRLSQPQGRRGVRLPFDFLLHSLATDCGERAVAVVLSGTGADGAQGLRAIHEQGGLIIVQDVDDAAYDGMPLSAIATGVVDYVLPAALIPEALATYNRRIKLSRARLAGDAATEWLPVIIELLRTRTAHDFTAYKLGTLQRRIERRMAMASIEIDGVERYIDMLRGDSAELDTLAKDLLINVTSFFRDPKVFDLLAEKVIPTLVNSRVADQPLRLWSAGCSTGQETYSLAMLLHEQIAVAQRAVKLQIFASDIDPDAVAYAREGLYSEAIEAEVSPARLARFFIREGRDYRVSPELRASVIFTVQDVLADPPFVRLDLICCRNLLIYLRPEAQEKVISLFHFALRDSGLLLLGSAETVGSADNCFQMVSKPERLYRNIGAGRSMGRSFPLTTAENARVPSRGDLDPAAASSPTFADLCRRLVTERYAPATVLVNSRNECLYFLGATDLYLTVASGPQTSDVLAMAREGVRTRLRTAMQQARMRNDRILIPGGRIARDGIARGFSVAVQPVQQGGLDMLLISFLDEPPPAPISCRTAEEGDAVRVVELERDLDFARTELQGAIRDLEMSTEEQRAVNEEALSVNEENQATNEELLASKEELQSLNEELTALNSQLHETLERQRTTSNDLQNVLYSTGVATVFLDVDLSIRFFTPATKLLFNVIPTDIGRPLTDLSSLSADVALIDDARSVLLTGEPVEREIEARTGAWYNRRILPYRTHDNTVEGVVITFADVSERRSTEEALEAARHQAQLANIAKSRFLAAASHDLRQPLQTLVLLQGLLAETVREQKAQAFVARLDETLGAMSEMLDALLDINQIEAGVTRAEPVDFAIQDLLGRMRDEFAYRAQSLGLGFRVVPCGRLVRGDPVLLEQMMRNLVSNALKYTPQGKVLVGCRPRGNRLDIEIWDTGIGIPEPELETIFEEYHQLDNAARERSRGLGLGLSIVKRLGALLDHRVGVRSQLGKGSIFTIEALLSSAEILPVSAPARTEQAALLETHRTGTVLVIEDDPELRELFKLLVENDGHRALTASDGLEALALISDGQARPDLILADYNLPHGMDGLQVAARLREKLLRPIPLIILTGDISTSTLRKIAEADGVCLNKPVKLAELTALIQRLLPPAVAVGLLMPAPQPGAPVIFVVDDSGSVRGAFRDVFEAKGWEVEDYDSCEAFLESYRPGRFSCLLVDANLPGMSGLDLLRRLDGAGLRQASVMITGYGDVAMAVQAMKVGALDFIEKPIGRDDLIACVARVLEQSRDSTKLTAWREDAASHLSNLTTRQREVMELVLAGHPNKNIAADLGVSQRTVESHRAAIMHKTGSKSLPALARLAQAAAWTAA